VPPIRIGGQIPVNSSKFFKHWFVAVTFVKYEGNVKNSNLQHVRLAIEILGEAYDTPTGAGAITAAPSGAAEGTV
jgi:hypothetical protein